MAETAARFRSRFSALHLGRPLLWDTAGVRALARVLDGLWPRTPGTAAVLVGHGSEHPGSMAYPALQGALDLMGRADLVVGTVEGWPDREAVLKRLEELRAERVLLLPLLLAAGVHAREDIAGPGPDSWNSALEAAGPSGLRFGWRAWGVCPRSRPCIRRNWSGCGRGRRTVSFEHYVTAGGKRLRCGYTTGTCAALAAAAAARLLLTGRAPETVSLHTPKGWNVEVPVETPCLEGGAACCCVTKDGGDDVDATHGLPICARVESIAGEGILLQGGSGVGRVTRPGLDQPVGEWAINHIPRQMIRRRWMLSGGNWTSPAGCV